MSQVYLAKHRALLIGETGNQIKSTQIKSNVGFWLEGKPEYPGKNLSEQSREPNSTPHMTSGPGIEPRAHWWCSHHCAIDREQCSHHCAIDRAEIVFHHLCFLLMYVQYRRRFFSTPT